MRREVRQAPQLQFVPSYGYVSLFPLLLHLLPHDSPELQRQLLLLRRTDLLWTQFGLRSLASNSSMYKKYNTELDAPYWRGQIWLNVNYLALRALKHYSVLPGPNAQQAEVLYNELRRNLLANVQQQYEYSGYLWEQYNDGDGHGLSSHPFTGWTALYALLVGKDM